DYYSSSYEGINTLVF
nr:immunoglobulin light chain junction region [Macaca mulatta]